MGVKVEAVKAAVRWVVGMVVGREVAVAVVRQAVEMVGQEERPTRSRLDGKSAERGTHRSLAARCRRGCSRCWSSSLPQTLHSHRH